MAKEVNGSGHGYDYWLMKPVMVQLRAPLAYCQDGGPVAVKCEIDGEEKEFLYGTPLPAGAQSEQASLFISGMLVTDPFDRNKLILRWSQRTGQGATMFETSLHPEAIAFVTLIPEHKPTSRIVT